MVTDAKSKYVDRLAPGDELSNELFLLQDVVRRHTKDGRPYILCTLQDRTGRLGGVFWDVPEYVDQWVRPGLSVLVTGKAKNFRDDLQINITDLNPAADPDMAHLLPTSSRPREELIGELRRQISRLAQPWQTLVSHLLLAEDFLLKLANAPAARAMHHAYIGGLLEHSLSMSSLADTMAEHYPHVDRDLLLAGTLLHDIGKASEYTTDGAFDFSEDGRLVGHIVRAIVMIEQAAAEIGFPEDSLRHLVHLVAAHHGTHEWGSPVRPKTLEAVLLHQIDLLDSRVQGFLDHVNNDKGGRAWTTKSSDMFRTELRRPDGLDHDPEQSA